MLAALRRFHATRDKADTLLLLAACLAVLAPHMLHLPLWTSALCLVTLCWRGWITLAGRRLPPVAVLLPVAAASLAMVRVEYQTLLGRNPGVAMLVLLLAFKLLEMRARRDLFVVVFLSLFIVLTNFFYSQTIPTALMMLLALVLLLAAQMSFQYTGLQPPLARRLKTSAQIVLLAVPLTAALFVLFPRIQGPLWGLPGDAGAARTGLSDSMAPGSMAELALSNEVAFRVLFQGRPPANRDLYWRAVVLTDFDGVTWTRRARHAPQATLNLATRGPLVRYQITQEPTGQRWLFALEQPRALPDLERGRARVTPELELVAPAPVMQRIRYDAASFPGAAFQVDESREQLNGGLRLPVGFNPRAMEYGYTLRQQHRDNQALVAAVLHRFRNEPFRYTLNPPPLGRDGIDDFLFGTRAGFCEHYAGAFVFVMRAAGVPARVVTGYQGGEVNPVDGYMSVRQSDAHAWAEVWLRERGWVRVDPTGAVSPARVERNLAGALAPAPGMLGGMVGPQGLSWFAPVRFNLAALGNAWNQWVLDYTPQRQKALIERLGLSSQGAIGLLAILAALAAALTLLPLLADRRRGDPLDRVYAAFCETMRRRGFPRAAHEGPRAYCARLLAAEAAPQPASAVDAFLTLYARLKYGSPNDPSNARSGTEPDARFGKDQDARLAYDPAALATLKLLLAQCR
jgi:transglutaminase-like putative cysteine protease